MFVLKLGDKYIRFESYYRIGLVDRPEKANLYTRKHDATNRQSSRRHYWVNGVENTLPLEVFEVEFQSSEKKVS